MTLFGFCKIQGLYPCLERGLSFMLPEEMTRNFHYVRCGET